MATEGYSPHIDGLRAVALLCVLFYHLGFSGFGGGFVGVDVFFVISGFLITRVIRDEVVRTGRFGFGTFYLRRARRLIPALLSTVAFSFAFAFLLFPPNIMEAFSESAFAAVLSFSNFHFWWQADYFDALAETKPLLHTWTLSVEMQFYFVWPVLLTGLLFARRAWLPIAVILALILGSTALAEHWLTVNQSTAFYLLPARAGELALGGLLVWLAPKSPRSPVVSEFVMWGGLAMIAASCLLLSAETRFPGIRSMLPCIGAALVILGFRARFAGALLRTPLMVGIGRISYSVYLVHWPLIVFWKAYTYAPLSLTEKCVIVCASLLLGWLQCRFVEERFRYAPKGASSGFGFAARTSVAAALVLIPFGLAYGTGGLPGRVPEERLGRPNAELRRLERQTYCMNHDPAKDASLFSCQNFRDNQDEIYVWGDSHALHLVGGLSEWYPDRDIFVAYSTGCDTASGFGDYVRKAGTTWGDDCVEHNRRILAYLEQISPATVILSSAKRATPEIVAPATAEVVTALEAVGHRVVVLGDFIRPGVPLNDCRMTPRYVLDDEAIAARCVGDLETIEEELLYNERLRSLLDDRYIDINELQCPGGTCRFFDGSTLLFRDHHHLSIDGSKLFIGSLRDALDLDNG